MQPFQELLAELFVSSSCLILEENSVPVNQSAWFMTVGANSSQEWLQCLKIKKNRLSITEHFGRTWKLVNWRNWKEDAAKTQRNIHKPQKRIRS